LIAKIFAPRVPLSLLTFAGEANDALFFVLSLLNIEHFDVDANLARSGGCFPYTTYIPYSHSLLIIAAVGAVLALGYALTARRPVGMRDVLVIFGCGLTHFLLELPAHRSDVKITPGDNVALGAGMFDHPVILFALEMVLFFGSLGAYIMFAVPSSKGGYLRSRHLGKVVAAVFIAQQLQFCFGS
jgi:hypothetical protein